MPDYTQLEKIAYYFQMVFLCRQKKEATLQHRWFYKMAHYRTLYTVDTRVLPESQVSVNENELLEIFHLINDNLEEFDKMLLVWWLSG